MLLVRDPREGLGEDVGGVLGARDVDDLDGARVHSLLDGVEGNGEVLGCLADVAALDHADSDLAVGLNGDAVLVTAEVLHDDAVVVDLADG